MTSPSSPSLSDDEELSYVEQLEKHHVEITKYLDLDRQYVLSHLRSKFILDDEDCQLITAGASKQQQAAKFIQVLMTKGPKGFTHFIEALEIEHPHLYEIITGNKPVGQKDYTVSYQSINPWPVLTGKKLLDFDRQYLVQELTKEAESKRHLTYIFEKLTHEKIDLEEKVIDMTKELTERDHMIEDLQQELRGEKDKTEARLHVQETENLLKVNLEKNNWIIYLQTQLLAANRNVDQYKNNIEDLRRKNETLMQQVRGLTIDYDFQRSQSRRLSEQVSQNHSKLEHIKTKKREFLTLKFELARVKEENENLTSELEKFKEAVAAMNVKCDMLQREKSCEEERRGEVSDNATKLQEELLQLKSHLSKSDALERKNERLKQELETHRQQWEYCIHDRSLIIQERDELIQQLDAVKKVNRELQKSRDDAVQRQISTVIHHEKKHATTVKELENASEELMKLRIKHMYLTEEKNTSENAKDLHDIEENSEERRQKDSVYDDLDKKLSKWKDRRNSDLLRSAYNKLGYQQDTMYPSTYQPGITSIEKESLKALSFPCIFGSCNRTWKKSNNDDTESDNDQSCNNKRQRSDSQSTVFSNHPLLCRQISRDKDHLSYVSHSDSEILTDEPMSRYRANAYDKLKAFEYLSFLRERGVVTLPRKGFTRCSQRRRRASDPIVHSGPLTERMYLTEI